MAGKFRKVSIGEKVKFSAQTHNAMIDAAKAYAASLSGQVGENIGNNFLRNDLILVRNDTGSNRAPFEILGIAGLLITPELNLGTFLDKIGVNGVLPNVIDHSEKFVILTEPIPKDSIGRGWLSGVAQVRIQVSEASQSAVRAGLIDGNSFELKAGEGGIPIIWKEDGIGTKWGLVRIGGGGGGSGVVFVKIIDYVGSDPETSEWLIVQKMKRVKTSAEGVSPETYDWVTDGPPEPAECWPNYVAAHYLPMRNQTPTLIVPMSEMNGTHYVWQKHRWLVTAPLSDYPQSDCAILPAS